MLISNKWDVWGKSQMSKGKQPTSLVKVFKKYLTKKEVWFHVYLGG